MRFKNNSRNVEKCIWGCEDTREVVGTSEMTCRKKCRCEGVQDGKSLMKALSNERSRAQGHALSMVSG